MKSALRSIVPSAPQLAQDRQSVAIIKRVRDDR